MSDHENNREEIGDDEQHYQSQTHAQSDSNQHKQGNVMKQQHIQRDPQQQRVDVEVVDQKKQHKKDSIDHEGISKYANFSLDVEDDQESDTHLRIVGNQSRGSAFTKYTTYIIKGRDKNGQVNVCRRFSQFHALRVAMVQRWPGCFIPSIPTKNFMHKNDKDQTVKRQRYLNDFVIKMTKLPYLYNSEQFQTFLRSKEEDTSKIYSSWSNPSNQAIINKYKDCFNELAGKQIDSSTNNIIGQFYARIKKNGVLLQKYRAQAKALALAKDKFNQHYPHLFSKVIPSYEKVLLLEYTNARQDLLVYQNTQEAKLNQHSTIIADTSRQNPYWALYDMIKHEERDGRAFLEALQAREKYQSKRNSVEARIQQNQKAIIQLMEGKTNIKSVTSKGTKQQVKYKLEVENEELKKEKNLLFILSDIISALIVYIEIPAYQAAKVNFYLKTWKKIGVYELNAVQIEADVWKDANKSSKRIGQKNAKGL